MKRFEKAVIFDMDGTLVDNISFHKNAWISFLQKHNIPIDPDNFDAQNHGTADEMMIRFFGENLSLAQIKLLGDEKELTYRDLYKTHIKEINGLTPFLKVLNKNRYKVGLATMGNKTNIDFVLDGLHIKNYFQVLTGGDEVSKGKPDPEIFLKTLEKLQVEKKNCLVIEDSISGIASALSTGIRVVGVATSHSKEELLDNGCYVAINDFDELELPMG